MFQKIEKYGTIRPLTAGNNANTERLKSLANLGQTVGNLAFDIGKKKRIKEGQIEGAKAGTEAAETGVAPEEKSSFIPRIFDDAFNDAQQGAYLASVDNQAITKLSELESQFGYDVEGYQKTSKGMLDGLVKNAPEAYRQPLTESINNYISRGSMRVNNNIVKRGQEESRDELLGAVATYGRKASADARNGEDDAKDDALAKLQLSADALVQSGVWSKEEAKEKVRLAKNETIEQEYLQIVDDMPMAEATRVIEQGEKNVPEGFSADEWDTTMARAKASLQSRITEEKKKSVVDKEVYRNRDAALQIAIKTGEGDSNEMMREATNLFNAGYYEPTKYAGMIGTIYNDLKKVEQVWARIDGDKSVVVDPATVDKVYKKDISGLDDASKVEFAVHTNAVPDAMRKEIVNGLRSQDADMMSKYADMVTRLDDVPGLEDPFSAENRALADTITNLSSYMGGQEAANLAMQLTDPRDKDRIESRKLELKEEFDFSDYRSKGSNALESWVPFSGSVDAMSLPLVGNEYKNLFETHYIAGMSKEDAHNATEKLMKKAFSQWNGHTMKNNPAKFYAVDGDSDWIKEDLIKEIVNTTTDSGVLDVRLISDDRTDREASSGRPTYRVHYRTARGWDYLVDSKGKFGRYYPDIDSKQAEVSKKKGESVKESIESARDTSKNDAVLESISSSGAF